MASFSVSGSITAVASTVKTLVSATQPSAATALGRMHRVHLGSVGTGTDAQLEYIIQRTSTLGTGTSVTPTDEDDTGSTATILGRSNYTVEPTYVASTVLFDMALAQRATFTVMLAPGREWRMQVTNNRGVGVGVKNATFTGTANGVIAWEE
jgi:hypothetical protein